MIVEKDPEEHVAKLRFRSDKNRIPMAVDQIMRFVKESGCVMGQEIEVELSLREALENAVVHGNRSDANKWVHVRCRCDAGDGVSIVVGDEGRGFDPRPFLAATSRDRHLPWQGDGLLIMRSYMDEVSFERGGTEVHLRKEPALVHARPSRSTTFAASPGNRI